MMVKFRLYTNEHELILTVSSALNDRNKPEIINIIYAFHLFNFSIPGICSNN